MADLFLFLFSLAKENTLPFGEERTEKEKKRFQAWGFSRSAERDRRLRLLLERLDPNFNAVFLSGNLSPAIFYRQDIFFSFFCGII